MTVLDTTTDSSGGGAVARVPGIHVDKQPATGASSPATEHTAISEAADIVRNNEEYMLVYRAIEALKAQLCRAKSDMGILQSLREHALAQPLAYVESVVSGTAPAAPARQEVVDVPMVDADAYLPSASPAAAARYALVTQPRAAHAHAATRPAPAILRSKPVRPAAAPRSSASARAKQSKRAEPRLPPTANAGQLTGNTAVATPEHSPAPSGYSELEAAGVRTAPASLAAGFPASTGAGHQTAPHLARASTQPVGVATQPGTPTRAGTSQKVFTPQMLAAFQKQASDDDFDEDEGVPLVASAGGTTSADGSLLFSAIPQAGRGSGSDGGSGTPVKRERAAASSRPGSAKPRAKPKAKAKARARPAPASDGTPKPPSYNIPWSDEEQLRLEQLLGEFPEEEVANTRWRKISEALGTRTMRQVASRVQKYFIKLAKAGLPVPGRVPDTSGWTSLGRGPAAAAATAAAASASKPGRRKRKHVDFTSSEDDDDDDDIDIDLDDHSDDGAAAPPADRKGKQVDWLGDVFDDAAGFELGPAPAVASTSSLGAGFQTPALRSAKAVHLGYRCDSCLAEPIVGVRWHCLECHGAHTVDLCDECREEGVFETDRHPATHSFHPCREAEMEPYYANEVAAPALHEYSYLA
ncbi:hypothetical protein IWQ57_001399 [Coemansia nantahalensis]|uniref:Uncharacterized protein n=1 Tax=Coemansia nantahalensis TaxID=2789366 RepID=A0ACC1K475_9FUNG|nr:hypothetical protein IWQ57_001399 [Coemansia nantahalensis]